MLYVIATCKPLLLFYYYFYFEKFIKTLVKNRVATRRTQCHWVLVLAVPNSPQLTTLLGLPVALGRQGKAPSIKF